MYVPTQAELLAKAAQLGIDLRTPGARARVGQVIQAERAEADAPAPQPPEKRHTDLEPILLSRTVSTVDGGQIVVDVHLIPNRTKENRTDVRADADAAAVPGTAGDSGAADAGIPGAADHDARAGGSLPAAECPA